eukprot:CAMPEP_0172605628 /NCGR_PEP_ID=MMETSP1068-20121228/25869_1 /TAXON_ID=35684 /ORGANISM="Pseudopedinella elastica, Strain CCMP716" /LENGTH=847 /DNA_ID=CAMNT_0013408087 /DNA_START=94 /DNA_END=2637 /DNA_ORIENTATION=-
MPAKLLSLWLLAISAAPSFAWSNGRHGDACTAIVVGKDASATGATIASHTDDCLNCDWRLNKVPAKTHPKGAMRRIRAARFAYPRCLEEGRGLACSPSTIEAEAGDLHQWKDGEGWFADIGSIPEVERTFGYLESSYAIANEAGVTMGETTCGAKLIGYPKAPSGHPIGLSPTALKWIDNPAGGALLDISELSRLGLERGATAREAIKVMGGLAEAHGFYGADDTPGEAGEALVVADGNEAWLFNILCDDSGGSAVWAAQRVPDDHVAVVANQFTIRKVDLGDEENFMASKNMVEVALRAGLWDGKGEFDFAAAFAWVPTSETSFPYTLTYAARRMWRIMDLAAPALKLPPYPDSALFDGYPISVKPEALVGREEALSWLRDHYEDTPYDMTKGLAAGPYGDPARYDGADTTDAGEGLYKDAGLGWLEGGETGRPVTDAVTMDDNRKGKFERAISCFRTAHSFAAFSLGSSAAAAAGSDGEKKNALVDTVVWFSNYAPHASAFSPVPVGVPEAPAPFGTGLHHRVDVKSAYWAHALVGNWADRFHIFTRGDVRQAQRKAESRGEAALLEGRRTALEALELGELLAAGAALKGAEADAPEAAQEKAGAESLAGRGGAREAAEILGAVAQASAAANLADWWALFWALAAKYKDGQRLDDLGAETLTPTKLWYPRSWLEEAGYFRPELPPWGTGGPDHPDKGALLEAVSVPPAEAAQSSGLVSWSHAAALVVGLAAGLALAALFAGPGKQAASQLRQSLRRTGEGAGLPLASRRGGRARAGYETIDDEAAASSAHVQIPSVLGGGASFDKPDAVLEQGGVSSAVQYINDFKPAAVLPKRPASPRAVRTMV